jgi:hypothetical protein
MINNTLRPYKKVGHFGPTSFPKNHELRKVIVLGAGVSKAFGLPLADELLDSMISWHEKQSIKDKLNIIFDFLEDFYPTFDRKEKWYPLAEDVLGMLETADAYIQLRSRGRGFRWRPGRVEAFRTRFIRLLTEYLWSFQDDLDTDSLTELRAFVQQNGTNVVYITFNYDLLLETALSLENIPYSYTLSLFPNYVIILKPHGSINWFKAEDIGKNSRKGSWHKLGANIAVTPSLKKSGLHFRKWKESVMVPPTPNKQIEMYELKKIWTSFSSVIHTTNNLIIAGYSLPDADRLARLVIRRAGPRYGNCKKILVINPSEVEKIYREYVSPLCKWVPMRFEDWVSNN